MSTEKYVTMFIQNMYLCYLTSARRESVCLCMVEVEGSYLHYLYGRMNHLKHP